MKAVVFAGAGRVRVENVADPALEAPTDAIVRVQRAAICGTDLHSIARPEHLPEGFVLGHEFVGHIVELGAGVRGHRVGDRVAGADYTACGSCWWCRRGDHWECDERRFFGTGSAFGAPLAGAQAELVRVPYADTVLRYVPDEMSADAAVLLGDGLATAHAAVQRGTPRPGDTVAVVGGGPVGQLVSLAAQACGAGVVIVVEPVASRRDLAAAEGALGVAPDDARAMVDRVTEGRGADLVIDAVGAPTGLGIAYGLTRRRGTVVSVGVPADASWPLPVEGAFAGELSLRFVIGNLMRDGDELVRLVGSGAIDPTVVASEIIHISDAPQAYQRMTDRRTLKALMRF